MQSCNTDKAKDASRRKQNPPQRHHYLPKFLSGRWSGGRHKKLCEFSVQNGELKTRWPTPAGTGYLDLLYSTNDLPEEVRHAIEDKFFAPVDTQADNALRLIEVNNLEKWQPRKHGVAWYTFILSLMMRMPEDVQALKDHFFEAWNDFEFRTGGDLDLEAEAMRLLPSLIENDQIVEKMIRMLICTLTTSGQSEEFLLSDRPVIYSDTMTEPNAFIAMPIGPHKLFLAVHDLETANKILRRDQTELIKDINLIIVSNAKKYVYGTDDSRYAFVRDHISSLKRSSLIERLRTAHRSEMKNRSSYTDYVDNILTPQSE